MVATKEMKVGIIMWHLVGCSSHRKCFVVKLLGHSDASLHLVNIFKYSDVYKDYINIGSIQKKKKLEQETYFLKLSC